MFGIIKNFLVTVLVAVGVMNPTSVEKLPQAMDPAPEIIVESEELVETQESPEKSVSKKENITPSTASIIDVCLNIEGVQTKIPSGFEVLNSDGICSVIHKKVESSVAKDQDVGTGDTGHQWEVLFNAEIERAEKQRKEFEESSKKTQAILDKLYGDINQRSDEIVEENKKYIGTEEERAVSCAQQKSLYDFIGKDFEESSYYEIFCK